MKSILKLIACCIFLTTLLACEHFSPKNAYGVGGIDKEDIGALKKLEDAITYDCVLSNGAGSTATTVNIPAITINISGTTASAPTATVSIPSAITSAPVAAAPSQLIWRGCTAAPISQEMKKSCFYQRNSATWALMTVSNQMCNSHIKGMYLGEAGSNLAWGSADTLFSGAATITTPVHAARILSALSTFSSAERSLINDIVYKDKLITSISRKINDSREIARQGIAQKLQSQDIEAYPMSAALFDVISYHQTCSFMHGLERALEEGAQSSVDALKAKLEREKTQLEAYIIVTKKASDESKNNTRVQSANARIAAIDTKLLQLEEIGPLGQAQKTGTAPPDKTDGNSGTNSEENSSTTDKNKNTQPTRNGADPSNTNSKKGENLKENSPTNDASTKQGQPQDNSPRAFCPAGYIPKDPPPEPPPGSSPSTS